MALVTAQFRRNALEPPSPILLEGRPVFTGEWFRRVSSQFKILSKFKMDLKIGEAERLMHKSPLMLNIRWLNTRLYQILLTRYRETRYRSPLKDMLMQGKL